MKKLLFLFSVLFLMFVSNINHQTYVNAATVETDEQGIEYTLNEQTNEYSVTGYTGNPTSIVIPSTFNEKSVTNIGSEAFANCRSLTSIVLPTSIINISEYTFRNCDSLTIYCEASSNPSGWNNFWNYFRPVYWGINETNFMEKDGIQYVLLKNTLTISRYIGTNTNVIIPSTIELNGKEYSVISIGDAAFSSYSNLISIEIPSSVTTIGYNVFSSCSSLTSIAVDKNNKVYDSRENCNAIIKTSINELMYGCKNTIIPNSVTAIRLSAFYGCSSLTSIDIPNSVTSIGSYAFDGCSSLTNIVIPENATSIGSYAFSGCSSLTNIVIPENVTSIGSWAFQYCSSLTNIVIPENVTSIGDYAFFRCSSLYEIHNNSNLSLEIGSTNYGYIAYYAKVIYNKDGTKTYKDNKEVRFIETEDQFKFMYEDGIYKLIAYLGSEEIITLPKDINENTYEIYRLRGYVRNVIISEEMTSIGSSAFSGCISLTSIIIPNSVTSIGSYSFDGCSSLTSIEIPNSLTSIGKHAFRECPLTNITIINDKTDLTFFPSSATFSVNPVYYDYYCETYPTLNIQKAEFILPSLNIEEYITSYTISPIKGTYEIDKVLLDGVEVSLNEVIDSKYNDGLHTLSIIDKVGLQSEYTFTIDNTNPVINSIENNKHYQSITIDITEINLKEILLNGEEIVNGYIVTDEGSYILEVTDEVNNKTNVTFIIDKTKPVIFDIIDGSYINTDIVVNASDENMETILLNSEEISNGYKVDQEGLHTLEAIDKAGNKTCISFVIDKTKPVIKKGYDILVSDYYNEILNLQISDNSQDFFDKPIAIEKVELINKVTNETMGITSFERGIQISKSGEYRLEVTDLAKNTKIIEFVIDLEAPTICATTNDGENVKENKYYNCEFIKLQFSDNFGIKKIKTYGEEIIQNGLEAECKNEGKYICQVIDIAGNETTIIFYIDRTSPKILNPKDNEKNEEVILQFEDEGEIEYAHLINLETGTKEKVNNGDIFNINGKYRLEVMDKAKNPSAIEFEIITRKPVIELIPIGEMIGSWYQSVRIKITSKKQVNITLNGKPILNDKTVQEDGDYLIIIKDMDEKELARKSFTVCNKPCIDISRDKKGNIIISNINKKCDVTIMKDNVVYKELKGVEEIEELLREDGTYVIIIDDKKTEPESYGAKETVVHYKNIDLTISNPIDLTISKQINIASLVISSICIFGVIGIIAFFKERKKY